MDLNILRLTYFFHFEKENIDFIQLNEKINKDYLHYKTIFCHKAVLDVYLIIFFYLKKK